MSKQTEIIERYLSGQMSAHEKKNFERELESNAELKTDLELHRQVMQGVQRHGMKEAAKKGFKRGSFKAKLFKWATALVIVAVATTLVWIAKEKLAASQPNNIHYELNEENQKQWADADKYLSPQIFEISGAKDTVIETSGGIVLAVPAGAFYDKFGAEVKDKIEIEIKEALDPAAIMQGGLSTTSDGKLLETGGMFYINARKNGENLSIAQNKGLYVNVPTDKVKEGMQLFEGKRLENGTINWVNPKPMETNIPTVDILSLNFYPPNFLDTVRSFGYDIKNKRLTDSIYYSLECLFDLPANGKADSIKSPALATLTDKLMGTSIGAAGRTDTSMRISHDPKTIFKQNCAVCHTLTDQKLTGPGLKGVRDRVPEGDWLFNYIKNNEKVIKSGDPYANKIFRENGHASMTVFEGTISDDDIRALAEYLGSPSFKVNNTGSSSCEIAPSRIRAIWGREFNNTILATPQFEERLKVIFQTCNGGILDLYVNNLNAKFCELDALAATMCADKPDCQHKFEEFAKRMDGGVSIEAGRLHTLSKYFMEKQQMYKNATIAAITKLYNEEDREYYQMIEQEEKHGPEQVKRHYKMLEEETRLNLIEAYRQLGKEYVPASPPANSYYSASITSTGWKNVDAYVNEATASRTTLDYTDKQTGKKAVIKYESLKVHVSKRGKYDRVYVYLIPDKLSSFQRIFENQGKFEEKLNETFHYDLVILGFKGNDVYAKQIADVKAIDLQIDLDQSGKLPTDDLLKKYTRNVRQTDLAQELQYIAFKQKVEVKQQIIQRRAEISYRLQRIALPCYQGLTETEVYK